MCLQICSVITQWPESHRTRNHTLLSHLRLPQPGGPGSRIHFTHGQGGHVMPPGTGLPLRRLLRLAGLWWRYSNPPPTWRDRSAYIYIYIYPSGTGWSCPKSNSKVKNQSHVTTDGQSISMSWYFFNDKIRRKLIKKIKYGSPESQRGSRLF
jgi:hypothetical protein